MLEYKMPPLAFNGNKKNMLKLYREALEDMKCYVNQGTVFYDVFGGSGLLAHETKRQFPHSEVVWNEGVFRAYHQSENALYFLFKC